MKKALQVNIGGSWLWVFCRNPQTGIVTTHHKEKAQPAHALEYFQSKMANWEFRVSV